MDTNTSSCWGQIEDIGRGGVKRRKDSHYTLTERTKPHLCQVYLDTGLLQPYPDLLMDRVVGDILWIECLYSGHVVIDSFSHLFIICTYATVL